MFWLMGGYAVGVSFSCLLSYWLHRQWMVGSGIVFGLATVAIAQRLGQLERVEDRFRPISLFGDNNAVR